MKRIILLAALAVSFNTQAVTFETTNTAGGKIVLTDKVGKCTDGAHAAYGTSKTGQVIFGCWFFATNRVFVTYEKGDVRAYEVGNFTIIEDIDSKPTRKANAL